MDDPLSRMVLTPFFDATLKLPNVPRRTFALASADFCENIQNTPATYLVFAQRFHFSNRFNSRCPEASRVSCYRLRTYVYL